MKLAVHVLAPARCGVLSVARAQGTQWVSNILIIKYHRREADGGCCRVMGKGSRWELGKVARRVCEGRGAYGAGASAGPLTPAPNVIIVLC